MESLSKTAQGLGKNPLGIIALFIVLIYGLASLVLTSKSNLEDNQETILIYFLVLFPIFVLGIFSWLVRNHNEKLFGPSDFNKDESFIKASVSLGAATAQHKKSISEDEVENIAEKVASVYFNKSKSKPAKRILWVDDRPDNNKYERLALKDLGFSFELATSTDEALEQLKKEEFNLIISDMGRYENNRTGYQYRAGYELLEKIRNQGNQIPFIIYAGSKHPEHIREAHRKGAQGSTNTPSELLGLVTTFSLNGQNFDKE